MVGALPGVTMSISKKGMVVGTADVLIAAGCHHCGGSACCLLYGVTTAVVEKLPRCLIPIHLFHGAIPCPNARSNAAPCIALPRFGTMCRPWPKSSSAFWRVDSSWPDSNAVSIHSLSGDRATNSSKLLSIELRRGVMAVLILRNLTSNSCATCRAILLARFSSSRALWALRCMSLYIGDPTSMVGVVCRKWSSKICSYASRKRRCSPASKMPWRNTMCKSAVLPSSCHLNVLNAPLRLTWKLLYGCDLVLEILVPHERHFKEIIFQPVKRLLELFVRYCFLVTALADLMACSL